MLPWLAAHHPHPCHPYSLLTIHRTFQPTYQRRKDLRKTASPPSASRPNRPGKPSLALALETGIPAGSRCRFSCKNQATPRSMTLVGRLARNATARGSTPTRLSRLEPCSYTRSFPLVALGGYLRRYFHERVASPNYASHAETPRQSACPPFPTDLPMKRPANCSLPILTGQSRRIALGQLH